MKHEHRYTFTDDGESWHCNCGKQKPIVAARPYCDYPAIFDLANGKPVVVYPRGAAGWNRAIRLAEEINNA